MEKRNHIEVCNLRESTSVLILEHIADWYALLIKARIILALTKHLCVLSLLDITGNFITVKVIIIEIILQAFAFITFLRLLTNGLRISSNWPLDSPNYCSNGSC